MSEATATATTGGASGARSHGDPAEGIRKAWRRLGGGIAIGTLGSIGMWSFVVALPAVQETLLLNGVRFQTRKDGESWITTVASGMGTGQSDLQTGDRIIAFMPTNELVDSQDDLARILRREIQNGNTQFNFAVNRDDEMWFATLRYAVSGN